MGVCETLMPDVVALEVHQNELLSIHYRYAQKLSILSGYTEDLKKKAQNCQNWEVGSCLGQYSNNVALLNVVVKYVGCALGAQLA